MAKITIVPDKDWDAIYDYLHNGVLIPEHVFNSFSPEEQRAIKEANLDNYDFGGDADAWIDTILSRDSYAARAAFEEVLGQNPDN